MINLSAWLPETIHSGLEAVDKDEKGRYLNRAEQEVKKTVKSSGFGGESCRVKPRDL
jgi:hypothetical protein